MTFGTKAKSAELELHESFISGMERAAEIVKSRLTNNDAKPYYEVWNSALYGAETAIRAELEPATTPDPLSQNQGDAKADED